MSQLKLIWAWLVAKFTAAARNTGRGVVTFARTTVRGARLFAGDIWRAIKYIARYTWRGAVGFASDARRLTAWTQARGPAMRTGAGYAASTGAAIWAGAFAVLTMTVRILALIIVVTLAINGAMVAYQNTTLTTHFDVRTSVTFDPFGTKPEPVPEAEPEEDENRITRRDWDI